MIRSFIVFVAPSSLLAAILAFYLEWRASRDEVVTFGWPLVPVAVVLWGAIAAMVWGLGYCIARFVCYRIRLTHRNLVGTLVLGSILAIELWRMNDTPTFWLLIVVATAGVISSVALFRPMPPGRLSRPPDAQR